MSPHLVTTPWQSTGGDWLIVGVTEPPNFAGNLKSLDDALGSRLTRLRELGDLTGKLAELVAVRDASPLAAKRVLLVGLGKTEELTLPRYERALLTAVRHISEKKCGELAIALEAPSGSKLSTSDLAQTATFAATVGGVGQGLFKTEASRFPFGDVSLVVGSGANSTDLTAAANRGHVLGEAVNVVRELVNQPAGDLYPESFAQRAKELAADFGLGCGVFDENWLKQERMGCMLAVDEAKRPPAATLSFSSTTAGERQPADRLRRQGGHLRQRRPVTEDQRQHAHDEVRHGGRPAPCSAARSPSHPAQTARQRQRLHGPRRKHGQRQLVQAGRRAPARRAGITVGVNNTDA